VRGETGIIPKSSLIFPFAKVRGNTVENIVEVVETGLRRANEFLTHGYTLLYTNTVTRQRNGPNGWYIRRDHGYVLGRTADVAHYEPTPRPTKSEEAGADLPASVA